MDLMLRYRHHHHGHGGFSWSLFGVLVALVLASFLWRQFKNR